MYLTSVYLRRKRESKKSVEGRWKKLEKSRCGQSSISNKRPIETMCLLKENINSVEKISAQISVEERRKAERRNALNAYKDAKLREKPVQLGGHGLVSW